MKTIETTRKDFDRFPYGGRMLNCIVQSMQSDYEMRVLNFYIQAAAAERELIDATRLFNLSLGRLQKKCLLGPLKDSHQEVAELWFGLPVAEVEDICACCCDACEAGEHCYTKNVCFDNVPTAKE